MMQKNGYMRYFTKKSCYPNQSEAMEILGAPRRTIKESDIFNDIKLSQANKVKHAASILKSRK